MLFDAGLIVENTKLADAGIGVKRGVGASAQQTVVRLKPDLDRAE